MTSVHVGYILVNYLVKYTLVFLNLIATIHLNFNGLQQRAHKTKTYLCNNNIDLLLVSEADFTPKCYMKISYYTIYNTKHPSGKAHGVAAVIIGNNNQTTLT